MYLPYRVVNDLSCFSKGELEPFDFGDYDFISVIVLALKPDRWWWGCGAKLLPTAFVSLLLRALGDWILFLLLGESIDNIFYYLVQ